MKITIEPTATIMEIDGHKARLWKGTTDKGTVCHIYVATIAAQDTPEVNAEFEAALGNPIPSPAESVIPLWAVSPSAVQGLTDRQLAVLDARVAGVVKYSWQEETEALQAAIDLVKQRR